MRVLIGLGIEGRGERLCEPRDQGRHAVAEAPSHAGRQPMRARLLRAAEIVEIDPVARRRAFRQHLVEIGERRRHAAGTVLAHDEDVEAETGNVEAEIQRFAGTGVAVEIEDLDSACGLHREAG